MQTIKAKRSTARIITKVSTIAAGIVFIAVLAWGAKTIFDDMKFQHTNDAQVQEYINPVIARVGGYIVAVKFEENQLVNKGDTLLIIDNREYVLEEAQTAASILKQQAELEVLTSTKQVLVNDAEATRSIIKAKEAKLTQQQLDYTRYLKLYEAESATKQMVEKQKANLDIYTSEYEAAKQSYDAAFSKLHDIESQKKVIYAEIGRLQAQNNRKALDVDYTVIRAPYNGRMGKRTIEVGQMINPGEVLGYIVNGETPKWVVANFKETQIAAMGIGDEVRVIADAYPSKEFKGKIISLSPATGASFSLLPPDNATGNYVKIVQRVPVRIELQGAREVVDLLKAGMNVNVYVPKEQPNARKK
ncbi:HlyD family secretion protein [Sphingobacteriaceae bacterium WQ 2009]|uniref:HlyD family secretion protein n=1 Tax=Rhinopithecimicrobium faecis TaxID=2820698 RepID=A0A8T4HGJ5_9SPHI|nr:HlyD family secretion protein [Sphingobacteriaceae bacterium WQ 2009]